MNGSKPFGFSETGAADCVVPIFRNFPQGFNSVLFDFDGTLAPCLDLVDLKRRVLEFSIVSGVPVAELEGLFIVEMVERASDWLAKERQGAAEDYHCRAHALIKSREVLEAQDRRLFPGVRDVLRTLRGQGMSLAVVTRNCAEAVGIMFPDIDGFFDTVLTRDHVTYLKPDPRHLSQALDEFGCPYHAGLMVGDGVMDMSVGKSLGMSCIGVLSGTANRRSLEHAGADLVLDNVAEMRALSP